MSYVRNAKITAVTQVCHRDTSFANANITAATQICHTDTSSANANMNAATQICRRDTSFANANITAATQICHRDASSANAHITAATQICHRDTSSANAHITAATQICHRDTSFANANITAATQICHTDTSFANANITAATQICHRDTSSANAHITAATQICHRDTSSANAHITAATQICHAGSSSANTKITATTSQPRPRRRQSAPQLRQEALCTAPATQRAAAATAATIRAAAPSGGSVYCACHTKSSRGHSGDNPRRSSFRRLCLLRLPHTEQPRPLRRQSAPQLRQEALCTAPATRRAAAATPATIRAAAPSGRSVYCACHTKSSRGHCGDNPRRSSFRRLCVLRLPHKEQPRPLRRQSAPQLLQEALCTAPATQRAAAATPATIRAAAPSGGSVYCACHTKSSRGHCGDNPRRSSFRRLCLLRLPHTEQPRPLRRQSAPQLRQEALCTAPATRRAAAATPATIRAAAPSGRSVYCACHTKRSRGHSGDNPRRSSFRTLCVLRLPHKEQPRPLRRQSAPQLLQEALCTAPATQRAAAATPATIRAAAPSGGSVYCACHTKSSRGHSGDNPRRTSFRKVCVLRLPHKEQPRPLRRQSAPQLLQEALCAAPATRRTAAATAATIRAAAPSGRSVYCACHTKSSRGHSGDNPRRTSVRRLCVLRLPSNTSVR